jgi:ankyrin repeat protein
MNIFQDHPSERRSLINAQGGEYGSALQAASRGGHDEVVQMLIDAGDDVNAQGGHYGNALQAASWGGHYKVVQCTLGNHSFEHHISDADSGKRRVAGS